MIRNIFRSALPLVCAAVLASPGFGQTPAKGSSPPGAGGNAGTVVSNPSGGAVQDRTSHSPAGALFVEKCGMCHRQMGMGTVLLARRMDPKVAMLEARTDLRVDFVVAAARNGIGNMPRIPRGEVSDAQLQLIARYLSREIR